MPIVVLGKGISHELVERIAFLPFAKSSHYVSELATVYIH